MKNVLTVKKKLRENNILKIAALVSMFSFYFLAGNAYASSSGPSFPTSAVDNSAVGTKTWSTPQNIEASDGVDASVTGQSNVMVQSNYLVASGYGFSIPSNATINGIQLSIDRSASSVVTKIAKDNIVSIVKADGSIGSVNKANTVTYYPLTETAATYGGSSDLWGETWTPADINNSNFGAVLSVELDSGTVGSATAFIDDMTITVYYTAPIVISAISSGTPSANGATITWSTDQAASSSISYGLDTTYGTVASSTATTSHSVILSGLLPSTTYDYQVLAMNTSGVSTSSNQTFTTGAPPVEGGCGTLFQVVGNITYAVSCGVSHIYSVGPIVPVPLSASSSISGVASETPSVSLSTSVSTSTSSTTGALPISTSATSITPMFTLAPTVLPQNTMQSFVFQKNLSLGSTGLDVKQLQMFLNSHGFPLSAAGVGSSGHETTIFGFATKNALVKFQKAHGIVPAVGYFGPITRGLVNTMN